MVGCILSGIIAWGIKRQWLSWSILNDNDDGGDDDGGDNDGTNGDVLMVFGYHDDRYCYGDK